MAEIGLPEGSGKRLKVREKSLKSQGISQLDIEWQPCHCLLLLPLCVSIRVWSFF